MIRFLFKQQQPRRFEFKPRFYNETKEYLESRKAIIQREVEASKETEYTAEGLRSHLSHSWRANTNRQTRIRSNRNVLLIAFVLFLAVYLLLRS